ncbi:MAG: hypothetical protein ACI4M5_02930 [Christensenellales bacterium]
MQKIKIKSTILVAMLIAIFSTIMCMGFVSAEEIGTNVDTIVGTIVHRINYYDKSGALIKTEGLLAGNNMTGIEGYEGDYVVRTENYGELNKYFSYIVPSEEFVKNNYVYNDNSSSYWVLNKDYEFTAKKIQSGSDDMSDIIVCEDAGIIENDSFGYIINILTSSIFDLSSNVNLYYNLSIDGSASKCFEEINHTFPRDYICLSFNDINTSSALFTYTLNINRLIEFTSIYDVTLDSNINADDYIYYYINETMSLDELTALNMDNVMSDTINVYTDIEPAKEPEAPTDEPTDEPSGDENGDIVLPPSDKPSDTDKPSDEKTIKSKLEKSNAELKAQWTALLDHDWQNANGWQLITLMTITLAVVIAIIVTIPIVCHQIKKATNVKRIKVRSAARKR